MKDLLCVLTLVTAASATVVRPLPRADPSTKADSSSSTLPSSVSAAPSATSAVDASPSACAAPSGTASTYFMDAIYASAGPSARGSAPFSNADNYITYHNVVKDFQAASDGSGDQTKAIQNAIDDGDRPGHVTTHPRTVFLPPGTYTLGSTVNLKMGTVLVGDAAQPPTLKAAANFEDNTLLNGYDNSTGHPEDSFLTLVKNIVLDSTAIDASKDFTTLQWGIAQGCGTTNVAINMPTNSQGHTGINLAAGSTIVVADVKINGGNVGIDNSNQQVNFKSISFSNCTTGYKASGGWTAILQNPTFDTCGVGADLTSGSTSSLAIVDGTSINSGTVVKFDDDSNSSKNNQVYIQNLAHDGTNAIAVAGGNTVLPAMSHVDTWIWGSNEDSKFVTGQNMTTSVPDVLLSNGKFATVPEPTFAQYSDNDVVNVKADPSNPVAGDGKTDDSESINAILASAAQNCKAVFFPSGVYVAHSTINVPPNSRLIGEAWSTITGNGTAFADESNPTPVVQIGKPGDTGVATVQDMRFTVADILPGAIIMQWNIKGSSPGDAGLWNSVINIGGAADSQVTQKCSNQDTKTCKAAFLGLHLSNTSSVYVENIWVWTADHAFDGTGGNQIISTHGGVLVEANPGPTWLTGVGSEHHWLFNLNFHGARNVYVGMLQTETPYMQGTGAVETTPAPWTVNTDFGDPDYGWCDDANDQKCHTAMAVNVNGGQDMYLYNSASWAFFHGEWNGQYNTNCDGNCQTNMNVVSGNVSGLHWAQVNVKAADVLVHDGVKNPRTEDNQGSWGGVLDAYEVFA